MPTVEDYFDDETDLPLPSSSKAVLPSTGLRGALLEEITDDGDDLDFGTLAEQGRGEYGANAKKPPPSENAKGKLVARDGQDVQRPSAPKVDPNTPMGGFMGDMMKLQEAEEERLAKLKRQFGNTSIAKDPSQYKSWNTVYPRYFDAKVSVADGRRVPRKAALWWPQATHIARACSSLGLPSVLEPEKTHPADWENPGRVKVQLMKDGKYVNPIVKNRTQLYAQLAAQMQRANPGLVPTAAELQPRPSSPSKAAPPTKGKKDQPKAKPLAVAHAPRVPQPLPALDERLPVHSPLAPTGVAAAAVKRDIETEKENKAKGLGAPPEGGKDKAPKMKRMVVRGPRR